MQSLVSSQARLVISSSDNSPSADSVLNADAITIEVPTDDIRVGDSVMVLPGETIPVDVCLFHTQGLLTVFSIYHLILYSILFHSFFLNG